MSPPRRRHHLFPAILLTLVPRSALSSSGYYCGSSYQDAVDSCSIACPSALGYNAQSSENECPQEQPYCFGPGLPCVPSNDTDTTMTTRTNATDDNATVAAMDDNATTYAPSPAPFSAQSEINLNFCGLTLDDANDCTNATWCPSGRNSDCPPGLNCFTNTICNATELDLVDFDLLANLTANITDDNVTADAAYMNGTSANGTSAAPSPAPENATYAPTIDLNPDDYYCSATWQAADYEGDCGAPCPSRSNDECPEGTYCYGPMPNCNHTYKVGVSTNWCGATFNDMASKCAVECRNGTDEECPEGEICWGGSPCALIDYQVLDLNASKGKLWCGKSYKDLVENCPKECPGATDEECGDGMICFNMAEEEQSCNETGVGIKEPVDSANLWCGSSWNDVLENCAKNCPEGSDEECGPGLICYDLTGNDLICETAGVGVKEKGDPQTRWCGVDFNDMLATCPKRCPETTECDAGQICFEGSPCVTEGVGVGSEEKDPDKMFCGDDYTAAMSCGTACPNGDADCPSGQSCFSDVECLWSSPKEEEEEQAMTDSTPAVSTEGTVASTAGTEEAASTSSSVSAMLVDVSVSEDEMEANSEALTDSTPSATTAVTMASTTAGAEETAAAESSAEEAPAESSSEEAPAESAAEEAPAESSSEEAPSESSSEEPPAESSSEEPPAESTSEEAPAESSEEAPAESTSEEAPAESSEEAPAESTSEEAPAESTSEEAPAEESNSLVNPFEETPSNSDTSSGVVAENLRMALYGLPEMTADHVVAWETLTASYFEEFYNDYTDSSDATRAAVNDVETMYEFTEMNIASSRRSLHIRRRLSDNAHLITYTQTTKYMTEEDVTLGDVVQYPFNDPEKRATYIEYLKESEPDLFASLEDVSTIFLPEGLESSPPTTTASPDLSSDSSMPSTEDEPASNSIANPFEEEESSTEGSAAPTDSKFQSFYCQNSGVACPSGECEGDDTCVFVSDGSAAVQVGSYTPDSQSLTSNPEDAAHMVSAVLSGEYKPSTTSAATPATGSGSTESSSADPLPYSDAEYGPKSVNGEMTLTGLNMIKVENIFEWQYLTAVYEQNFYNNGGPIGDAVKDAVYNFATVLEAVDLSYGEDGGTPTTVIKFKQTFKYDTTDPDLSSSAIATRPFLNEEDRDNYIAYLKEMLPDSFGSLTDSSSAPQSTEETGSANNNTELLQKLTDTFYCAEAWPVDCQTAQSCKTGDNCPDGQTCFTSPTCALQQNSAPLAASDSDNESSDPFSDHDASYGPSHVNGEMTLTGMNMIEVDNIFEWEDLTALFEEQFYNVDDGSQDYVKNTVHNFATVLEALALSYGDDDGTPTTIIKFKQSVKYDSKDPDIPVTAIVTQPFLTPEYREKYIDYLKEMLPNSFGDLTTSSSVPDSEANSEDADEAMEFLVKLRQTFFCSESYPVDCQTAQRCESGDNCPDGQTCFTAPTCAAQQGDSSVTTPVPETSTTPVPETSTTPVPQTSSASLNSTESGMDEFAASLSESSSKATVTPSTTTASSTTDSTTTSISSTNAPTPSPYEDEFFCGTSWLDASDKCTKPCPSGDASDCDEGEGCFAFTSCEKTESFYCGYNFEDASSSCEYPCSGMNVLDCPKGMGCFQYTTCQGVNSPSNETNTTESESDLPRDAFCGTSLEDAEASCAGGRAISCQVGNDSQCPGGMECFGTTTCTSRDSFYCGASWKEAAETCGKPCSSGSSDECDEGQFCFAYTGCESNLFFCGESYESASESCTSPEGPTPCSNQSPGQCPENQYCFAFVTACASSVDSMSLGAFSDFEGSIQGSDASSQERPDWLANYWETKPISSSSMKRISLYLLSVSSMFLMLTASL